jgi:transmembrane sensor
MNAQKFKELLHRYQLGTCSDKEKELVEAWYDSRSSEMYNPLSADQEIQVGERMYGKIIEELKNDSSAKTKWLFRPYRLYWLAAASLIAVFTGGYFLFVDKSPSVITADAGKHKDSAVIVPGGNKALLTLDDGSVIVLDNAANDTLSKQGNTIVFKKRDGQLEYHAQAARQHEAITFNTISTPRGGQYQVVLPDGSKVWLNAASSLRFPTMFTGEKRIVELTGEAYFEVVHDAKKPFMVSISSTGGDGRNGTVEVLGTHFNIMAYSDEASMNTTLLEGAIKFNSNASSRILKPGQQARLIRNGAVEIKENADIEEAIAWKNGLFQFQNADITTVMRQVARWYDVEVEYAGKVPAEKFEGEIPRSSNITEVIKMLELSKVHCKIEGKKITILP